MASEIDESCSPQAVARHVADAMWAADRATRSLGMVLDTIGPGQATLSMRVTAAMTNGHHTAHGGFIFTLADSAFAFACNSHGDRAVAAHCSISFLQPARLDDELVASAREITRSGRNGIYDVSVTTRGLAIAEFRGTARIIGGSWLDQT